MKQRKINSSRKKNLKNLISKKIKNEIHPKKSEETVRESEDRINSILESLPLGVAITTPEGDIVEVNSTLLTMFGYQSKEEVAKISAVARYRHSEDREKFVELIKKQGFVKDFEAEFKRRDDTLFWGCLNSVVHPTKTGLQFITSLEDITERKRLEEMLQKQREELQIIIDTVPAWIFYKDKENRFIKVNKPLAEVMEMSKEQLEGKSMSDLYPREQAEAYWKDDKEVMESGKPKRNIIESMESPKGTVWVQTDKIPYRDAQGNIIGIIGFTIDITEREQAEEAIRALSAYNRSLIETSIDPLVTISPDGKITDVNTATEEVTGYSRNDLVGKDFSDYFTEPEKARAGYQKVFRDGFVRDYELEIRHRDGRVTPVLYNASVYRDKSGKVIGIFAAARDITERKQTEEQLRESEEKFRKLMESLPIGVAITTPEGVVSVINPIILKMLGYDSKEEILKSSVSSHYYDARDRERFVELLKKYGMVKDFEAKFKRKDGTVLWGSVSSVVQKTKGGGTQFINTFEDITERKKAEEELEKYREHLEELVSGRTAELEKSEEALRKSEEHLRLITDSLPVLISYIDSEQRYRFNNKTYEEWFGHSSKEIYGKHIRDVLGEQAYQTVSKYIETVLSGETITYEDYVPYKDGGMRYIKASYIPHFDEQKKVKGYFSLVSDITGRKQAEENLRKTLAELERSNKELEQFAYVASHDLQEPLRMVASFVSLLEKRYGDKLNTEAKEFINYAVEGSNRLQKLINDLLVYSRLSTRGKSFEPVDCHSILGQIIVNLSVAIEENQAIITNDDLPNVMADSSQMVQLFQNLIENAIRFRSKENPQIHISATEKGDEWVFSVRDNGIGIDPEHFERIFVIFQRLNPRADYPGAGMGLSICKKIVERHGGKIWVNSEPAKGSTFYFTIPKRR